MNVPLVSLIFLKRSLVFPILLFSSISLHWSLRKAFLPLLAILWNSAFKWLYLSFPFLLCLSCLFFSQLFVRSLQTTILPFFSMGMVLIPVSCTMSWTSVHSSSGTLSIRSNPLNLFFTSLLFTAICKASLDSHFAFFAFLFRGDGLDPCFLYNVTNLHP